MLKKTISTILLPLCAAVLLSACSPTFNWRDYRNPDAAYSTLFPAKPSSHSREVDLDGLKVNMSMTAVDIENTTFAVGSAELADAVQTPAALAAMKTAMMRNAGATVTSESTGPDGMLIDASGKVNGKPVRLVGRFVARGKRVYQVIVFSRGGQVKQEQIDMFMSAFKLN